MYTHILGLYLGILGCCGIAVLLTAAGILCWLYRNTRLWSLRWHWRNWRMLQLSALACLFCLAMAASYCLLGQVWGWLYLIAAFKSGTWWLRCLINRRM
jgi:ABC-type transport system involved in multi-copper enzyme maturation permease subunit